MFILNAQSGIVNAHLVGRGGLCWAGREEGTDVDAERVQTEFVLDICWFECFCYLEKSLGWRIGEQGYLGRVNDAFEGRRGSNSCRIHNNNLLWYLNLNVTSSEDGENTLRAKSCIHANLELIGTHLWGLWYRLRLLGLAAWGNCYLRDLVCCGHDRELNWAQGLVNYKALKVGSGQSERRALLGCIRVQQFAYLELNNGACSYVSRDRVLDCNSSGRWLISYRSSGADVLKTRKSQLLLRDRHLLG